MSFDPEPLISDLAQLSTMDWVRHFNTGYFEGQWTVMALRSPGGITDKIYPDPNAKLSFASTPTLDRCPHTRRLLESFHCPLFSVRFLRLAPGAIIREHRDYNLGFDQGQVRLHIPIITNPGVAFFLDAQKVEMNPGECWYLDLSLPHWVENRGASDRIHLVIDCEINDWVRQLLASAGSEVPGPQAAPLAAEKNSLTDQFDRFRLAVLEDLDLQEELRVTGDWQSFARLAVRIGQQRGYEFTESQVEQALMAARQEWLSRWID